MWKNPLSRLPACQQYVDLFESLFIYIIATLGSPILPSTDLKPCPNPSCHARLRKAQRKPCIHCHKHPADNNQVHLTNATDYAKAITDVRKHLDKVSHLAE
jgi:hypothetical protein